jgi:diguanylate cyclase (GGDEF)-like protein/PAS domain S-box-containing protein
LLHYIEIIYIIDKYWPILFNGVINLNLTLLVCFLLFFTYVGLGTYTISRNPRSVLNRIFFAITLGSAIWVGAYSCVFITYLPDQWILFWFRVSSIGWIFLAPLVVHFALVLIGRDKFIEKWKLVLLYLPAVLEFILVLIVIHPDSLNETSKFITTGLTHTRQHWFWPIHILYFCSYSIAMLIMVAKWGRNSVFMREKKQARIIVGSELLVLLTLLIEYIILPFFGFSLPWIDMLVGLVWAGAILYAITKYKLMDLNKVLSSHDILTKVTDMVLLLDRTGHVMMANKKACEILGYSKDELLHMSLMKIIPNEELRHTVIPNQDDLIMESEVYCQTSKGELIPIKAYFASIVDNLRDIVGILVIGQDLSLTKQLEYKIEEKNQIELALRESEAKFRNIYENAHDLIYMHDLNGRFLSVNKAAEKLLGYSQEELTHMNTLHVVVPEQRQMVIDMFNQQVIENQPVYYELTVMNRHGEKFDLDVSRQLIFETPEAVIYQCIARDITERKQMEEKLRYLSMHDAMTGLYNRAYFTEELKRLENGRFEPVSIILCDLDYLKNINDTYGHTAGDETIITAAQLIKSCFRSNDVVARFGGDEFAIVVPISSETVCRTLADKIRTAVAEHNKLSPFVIGISIGYAVRSNIQYSVQDVLKQADQAMYADKASRRVLRI